jgi:PiT family inorganic phosphate transporter
LSPTLAVAWAAFFNFVAAFGFGVKVASTIGKGIVEAATVNETMILAALVGAILWTHLCTRFGLPISVSHALIGGLVGAALVKTGIGSLLFGGLSKVVAFIFLAPLLGLVFGFILMVCVHWVFRHWSSTRVDRFFRVGQLAQKTMGIIAILLFSSGYLGKEFYVPTWVILSAHAAIATGTFIGGWRVVRTMGARITKLQPVGGFCAETAGAIILHATAQAGIPVSTTHTIAGSITGVGMTRRLSAVRWSVAGRIVWAWILTIPASALMAAIAYEVVRLVS